MAVLPMLFLLLLMRMLTRMWLAAMLSTLMLLSMCLRLVFAVEVVVLCCEQLSRQNLFAAVAVSAPGQGRRVCA